MCNISISFCAIALLTNKLLYINNSSCFTEFIFPISFLKFIHFNDVISPFLEGYFNNASEQILALQQMYLNWSYLPISDEYYLLKSVSFLLPSRAWLLLDTFFRKWTDKCFITESHINNPKIPLKHVEKYGHLIWSDQSI